MMAMSAPGVSALPQVVVLKTGERVIGEPLPLSDGGTLYLKSDLLGELAISRQSIASLRPKNERKSIQVGEPVPAVVSREIRASGLSPSAAEATEEKRKIIDRIKELQAPKSWAGNLRVGLNSSRGDRQWDETFMRGNLKIQRKGSPHFYRLNGSYSYRLTRRKDGTEFKSNDRYSATFTYRRSLMEDWFVQNALGGRVDQLKGINREIQNLLGLGYRIKPGSRFELLFGGGGGVEYFDADFEEQRTSDTVVNLFQEFTYRPSKRTSFIQEFRYYVNPENSDSYNYLFKAAVRLRLTNLLGFEFSYNKDFDNEVGPRDVEDDTQFRNALVVYF